MNKVLKSIFTCFAILTALTSCEGPQGPMGNANVTIWKTSINSSGWVADGDAYGYAIDCPIINSEVVNGLYQVTASINIGGLWVSAPYITAGLDYTETCQFVFGTGSPNAFLYAYSDDDITTLHEDITEVKIAVIEGLSGKKEWTVEEIEANSDIFNIKYLND
jgi:hypothetical protein